MSDSVTRVVFHTRLDPGVQLNDTYEIDERIASGGMGEVYRGHNIQTGEPVAIKAILPELADQEAIFALFKREATVLGRLHHDSIVRYYSFSRDPRLGRPYLAMEFVDGISLADRIQTAPLTPQEVRKLFTGVADGLAIAHGAGVIHRDLSPDNIILRDGDVGRPKLIDFGIARAANVGEGTLIGGGFAGKFNFVSPEQLGIYNREVDARSDVYSLGLVIAASLRGRPIDMGGSHVEVIDKRRKVPDLSDIDESLRPLLEAMLQPNPDDRPAGAAAVSEWLRTVAGAPPAAAPTDIAAGAAGAAAPSTSVNASPTVVSGPTGGRAAGSATQSDVWQTPASPAGTPFAAPEPTQIIATPTAPPWTSISLAGTGESPFGNATGYPPAGQTGLPGTPFTGAAAGPVARKSRAGRYVMAGGLALLLLGGGGAYMAGLIGPAGERPDNPQPSGKPADAVEAPVAKTEAPPPTTPDASGATPEHEAIGKALEEFAKADEAKKIPPAEPAPAPVAEPAPQPAETAVPTNVAVAEEPADLSPPATADVTIATPPGPVAEPPAGTGEQTQVAAAGVTKMVDVGVSWLRQYDGGKCFFAAVTSVSDKSIFIKGFGRDVASFQKLYNSFIQTNGIEPELNGHLINEGQCAATDFLKTVQPLAKHNPAVTLAKDKLRLDEPLTVTVDNTGTGALDLLLVDGDGLVHNMKVFSKEKDAGDSSTFDLKLGGKVDAETPEMIIALTSPSGLAVPKGSESVRATELFPRLAREVEGMNGQVGLDFAYFRLSK